MKISDLDTPAVLVDLDRAEANIRRWQQYCHNRGIRNRPHIKTHKLPELAQLQIRAGAYGITCQKLGEVEVMVAAGIEDVLLAYNVVGEAKLRRLSDLHRRIRLSVVADSEQVVSGLARGVAGSGKPLPVLVEVATRLNRCGVPTAEAAAELARFIARQPGLTFAGFLSYPSDSHSGALFQAAADRLGALGSAPIIFSGGGTPAMWCLDKYQPLTEYRAGSYIYNDRVIVREKAATLQDCALTVLVTVVSTAAGNWAVVDGGTKAFSSDQYGLAGFGVALNDPTVLLDRCTEEHGMVGAPIGAPKFAVGDRLRLVPNHACVVSNLHDVVYAVRGDEVVACWAIAARGKLQ